VNRKELETAIARASEILDQKSVLVFGSQAILASFDFEELPPRTTLSREADIAPERDIADFFSGKLWLEAGQGSEWAENSGFFIDAVSADTAYLPDGWRDRAIEVAVPGHPDIVGICPDALDICASKMARNEEKDREFVSSLIAAGMIDARTLRARFDRINDVRLEPARANVARRFIIHQEEAVRERRG
jgi:hypothetical protein